MLIRNVLTRRVGLVLGLCALAALPASAEYDNGYGYLRAVEGSATLMQAGSGTRTPAEVNQPVLAGDRLWVPERSRVEIVLADRNLVRIDGGSEVVLERLAASPDSQDRGTVLRLMEGNLQLVVVRESLGDELPRVNTPNTAIYVQDYGVFRISADQEVFTELVVRSGRAEVVTDRGRESVRADEQAFVENESIDVQSGGSYDNLERWARRLDEEGNVDSEYLDGDLRYAAAPLARYGSWIDYQGTSYWRPRVEAGWRPYWNGRWAYTPSGNTWVSYDPWGWVPHHYGSWDYLPAYGWVWQPGRSWAPAWVYWYQGPSYTGWCPVGYYTRYYGARWGAGFGFHTGVYGWAGGDWGGFASWTFVSTDYWHGYRDGYRDGRHDDWRNRRNVQRYAVSIDELRRRGPLDRGLITTDSRPLTPEVLQDPRRAVRVLSQDPSARRMAREAGGELPDMNDFISRKPDLTPGQRRAVVADGDVNQLDGTPMRPDRMGRGGEGGRSPEGVRGAREIPGGRTGSDSGRSDRAEGVERSPRAGGSEGGYRRPDPGASRPADRDDRGVRALPRDNDTGGARPRSGRDESGSQGYRRPEPGSERPTDRSPRDTRGTGADSGYRRPETRGGVATRPESGGRPEASERGVREPQPYERPSGPSSGRGGYERPASREPERSERSSSSREGNERPSSSSPRTYERSAPPSSSRGGYERSTPPPSSRGSYEDRGSSSRSSERSGSSTRSSERDSSSRGSSDRGSSGRGSSDRGSSGSRSARRPPQSR